MQRDCLRRYREITEREVISIFKKKIFFPVLALAIITAAVTTSSFVSAQDTTGANSLVAAIAQKFNLNQNDVQAVFDEERNKSEAQMKTQMEAKLTQAVTDGKITEAQKQAIIAKMAEMKNNRPDKEEFQNLTKEQRKARMDEKKAEMDTWLSQNGLTREVFQQVMGAFKGGHGRRMMMKP